MKRVLAVVASLHLAPSHASSGGWGAAGSTTGSGGAWPKYPSNIPAKEPPQGGAVDQQNNGGQPPLESSNHYHNGADSLNPATAQQQQQQQQQQPPYDPPHVPQDTRWAGQHYNAPVNQHQHEHQPQYEHYPPAGYAPPPGRDGNGGDDFGKPLHLGTKWRTLVSRVKDAVRPGQPSPEDYWQGARGYDAGYGDGGGGSGYPPPPGSSWVGGVNENTGYESPPPGVDGRQPLHDASANAGFVGGGHHRQQPESPVPPPAGYDPFLGKVGQGGGGAAVAAPPEGGSFDYHQDQRRAAAAPPASFDPRNPSSQQPRGLPHDDDGGGGRGDDGSWQSPPPAAPEGMQPQPPDSFGGHDTEEASSRHGHETQNAGGYADGGGGGGDSRNHVYGAEGGHGTAARESPPPLEPPPELRPASAGVPVVGQGWSSAPSADPAPDPAEMAEQGASLTSGERAQGVGAATAGASGILPYVQDGRTPPPPSGSASGLADSPGWDVPGSVSTMSASRASADAALAKRLEGDQRKDDQPADAIDALGTSTGSSGGGGGGGGGSYRLTESGGVMDTMPSSADHGMEKVDWGKGAEETEEEDQGGGEGVRDGAEGESGETEAVPGAEERLALDREEKALIRELERMDSSIGHGGEPPDAHGEGVGGSSTRAPPPRPVEDQARIEEAVEHQLDDLFDSLVLDGAVDVDVDEDRKSSDASDVSFSDHVVGGGELVDRPPAPASEAAEQAESAPPGADRLSAGFGEADERTAGSWQAAAAAHRPSAATSSVGSSHGRNGSPQGNASPSPASLAWSTVTSEADGEEIAAASEGSSSSSSSSSSSRATMVTDAAVLPEAETAAVAGAPSGSSSRSEPLWGNTRRWESLPVQPAAVVSDPGEEQEHEEEEGATGAEEEAEGGSRDFEDEEDEADVGVPLDPIELPPSAATDEIWNDQHLQDQLDAYWEQSRKGGVQRQPSTGVRQQQQQEQQLSAYGLGSQTQLQPTYGPGDWVGTGRASRPGEGFLSSEPLPGGVARPGGWVAPHVVQGGNQAPINIYGNVHVHLQQGSGVQDGGAQQRPQR
ncbi:unnamed protein product, partial [Scytosiphon promiscuus]